MVVVGVFVWGGEQPGSQMVNNVSQRRRLQPGCHLLLLFLLLLHRGGGGVTLLFMSRC